ncbi:hypothetical protein ACV35A_31830, partial [Pseudomonas aeruginosa]
ALWLALELFRSWFLTGFPWLYAGYSQLQGPLAGLVPVGGVWLSSFVIALSAALLVNLPRLFPHGASLLLGLVLLLGPWAAVEVELRADLIRVPFQLLGDVALDRHYPQRFAGRMGPGVALEIEAGRPRAEQQDQPQKQAGTVREEA